MTGADWQEERAYLVRVLKGISERLLRVGREFKDIHEDVMHERRHFWDDITIKEDMTETQIQVNQKAMVLSEVERRHRQGLRTLKQLGRLQVSPYFGRIDFREELSRETEKIYLGVASFLTDDKEHFLIYDWRAPVSSLYYDYGPGPASYQAPIGQIRGEVVLKRQFGIRDGEIRVMFDTGVTIGDELLMEALSRHSTAEMHGIVATIQAEQNRIIRDDRSRLLVVQGVAGSGKTSAALQRVAYLLYRHRETLQAKQMVLFSPNPLFNSYVSTVLPELGEENMQQTTFQEYLTHRLKDSFQVEDPLDQLEYVLTSKADPHYDARLAGVRYKSSGDYLELIGRYARTLETATLDFHPLRYEGREVVSAREMAGRFAAFSPGVRLSTRVLLLRDWLLGEVKALGRKVMEEDWVDDEINYLSSDQYAVIEADLRRQQGEGDSSSVVDQERQMLGGRVVSRRLRALRKWIGRLEFVDMVSLYGRLFRDPEFLKALSGPAGLPAAWPQIAAQTISNLGNGRLAYEDATPFLYLSDLVRGTHQNLQVRHVIIDEAQDYSPFQFEYLRRLFPQARMTVLGDVNQAVFVHAAILGDLDSVRSLYPPEETEGVRLMRSYRSTREIVEMTRGLLPGGEAIIPFDRHGEKPRLTMAEDPGALRDRIVADVHELEEAGHQTIAIICKTAVESRSAHRALGGRLRAQLLTKDSVTFAKGTVILPSYLAKGMEFDAVLIHDASEATYHEPGERKLFYTACTRAMHCLHIFSVGKWTPFLETVDPKTYDVVAPV